MLGSLLQSAGLLAWIIEKMWRWVDGDLEACISRDELLTNISLFWFTQSITSSMRLYREAIGPHSTAMPDILKHRCTVSTLPHCHFYLASSITYSRHLPL